ncbi:MAG: bacteriohemerythrin [Magnetococcales bacterium]|nr:bacteriohemerythrin [Magnetococcales bacterium]
MNFINRLNLKNKFLLLFLGPLVALIFYGADTVWTKRMMLVEIDTYGAMAKTARQVGPLMHEIQKERGMTAGFQGSKGAKFKDDLIKQRELTNTETLKFRDFLRTQNPMVTNADFEDLTKKGLEKIDRLNDIRWQVDSGKMDIDAAIDFYTGLNQSLMDLLKKIVVTATHPQMMAQTTAYLNLLNSKERAGLERALLGSVFAGDTFPKAMRTRFMTLMAEQGIYDEIFLSFAREDQATLFRNKLSGEAMEEIKRMRNNAIEKMESGGFGVDPVYWFDTMTHRINLLKEIELQVVQDLASTANLLRNEASFASIAYLVFTVLIVGVTLILGLMVLANVRRQLGAEPPEVMMVAEQMSMGNFSVRMAVDEHSEGVYKSLHDLQKYLVTQLGGEPEAVVRYVDRLAGGDLSSFRSDGAATGIFAAMGNMVENLRESVGSVIQISRRIVEESDRINRNSQTVSDGAIQQAASITQTAASMEQMTVNIQKTTENAQSTEEIARASANEAVVSGQAVSETVDVMKQIAEEISIIDEIAHQTSLLSLNASLEATRAGEYGRGFAVVASEVRKLAERSQSAAAKITALSTSSVEVAVKAGRSLQKLVPDIQHTAELVRMISIASREQSQGLEQINIAVQQLDQVIRSNVSAATTMRTSASALSDSASELQNSIAFFQLDGSTRLEGTISSSNDFFPWNDNLSVGIREMDKQHKRLVELINLLAGKIQSGRAEEGVKLVLPEIREYTLFHFNQEEELFTSAGYPDAASHKDKHKKVIERVVAFIEQVDKGDLSVANALLGFLRNWLISHIMKVDKQYGRFINEKLDE